MKTTTTKKQQQKEKQRRRKRKQRNTPISGWGSYRYVSFRYVSYHRCRSVCLPKKPLITLSMMIAPRNNRTKKNPKIISFAQQREHHFLFLLPHSHPWRRKPPLPLPWCPSLMPHLMLTLCKQRAASSYSLNGPL